MYRSSNPMLNADRLLKNRPTDELENKNMTMGGVVNKTFILLVLAVVSALISVNGILNHTFSANWLLPLVIVGFVIAVATTFVPVIAPYTAPLYAIVEGVILGMLSYIINLKFPGIAFQAVALTFLCLLAMLFCYTTKLIKVTEKFVATIMISLFAILILYVVDMIGGIFPVLSFLQVPMINDNSILGIAFSVLVCIIASLSLLLDFEIIKNAAEEELPKSFEWYCGFSLMVTLVWLYLEILRLLSKVRSR